jgi:hypothetical protein
MSPFSGLVASQRSYTRRTRASSVKELVAAIYARGCLQNPANPAECGLIQQFFGFMVAGATPARIIGDKACDSDRLDESWRLRESR